MVSNTRTSALDTIIITHIPVGKSTSLCGYHYTLLIRFRHGGDIDSVSYIHRGSKEQHVRSVRAEQ